MIENALPESRHVVRYTARDSFRSLLESLTSDLGLWSEGFGPYRGDLSHQIRATVAQHEYMQEELLELFHQERVKPMILYGEEPFNTSPDFYVMWTYLGPCR